ncbi:HEPN domain-containing protein [Methyloceanibacter caenitepidi]|nr:HEPN domain-containing protein [Methyloceanibacter caenitepidi]
MEVFKEWFAVRMNHSDDETWPGRLSYDPNDGIYLNAINFAEWELGGEGNPYFEGETITGYLDYQTPTTLVRPFIQNFNPGSIGRDFALTRARYRVVANGILKKLHLETLGDRCFEGFNCELPSFHAWIAPQLVQSSYSAVGSLPLPNIVIGEPSKIELSLSSATAEVVKYTSAGEDAPIRQHTVLSLVLSEPADYEAVMRLVSAIEIMFSFLIGARLETSVLNLPTTRYNEDAYKITAECWIVPAWKRAAAAPHPQHRLFTEGVSPVDTQALLDRCLSNPVELISIMNVVLCVESNDGRIDDSFGELLGALEAFDKKQFGSGADPNINHIRKQLKELVEKHGTEEQKAVCVQIGDSFRNEYSLRKRLKRLYDMWKADGFKGDPDLGRIVDIRNLKPHGRGHRLSPDVVGEIIVFMPFLCALARYHILKVLGFSAYDIGQGFRRMSRYQDFV